jgi:hypothetical protein
MTALETEASCGAGDPGAVDTRNSVRARLTQTERLAHTRLACRGRGRLSGYLIRPRTTPSVLLYSRTLRMTHNRADAQNLLQAAMARTEP